MKITQRFIDEIKTANGGWSREQMSLLGEGWPPLTGWRDRVHGRDITRDTEMALRWLANGSVEQQLRRQRPAETTRATMVSAQPGTKVSIWTDGSCFPNPGPGGWAWHDGKGREESGAERKTTNNRMELTAILRAMQAQTDGAEVVIYSDSQYCVNGLTIWSADWKRKKWMKNGEPMLNCDLWLDLEEQKARVRAQFRWVRGHNGDANNERADFLAGIARANPQ